MLTETDHRIGKDEEGIPTIMFGCGGILVSTTWAKDGSATGISLSLGEGEIGQLFPEHYGKTCGEVGAFLKIVATKVESIDVLIGKLEMAKKYFGDTKPPLEEKLKEHYGIK